MQDKHLKHRLPAGGAGPWVRWALACSLACASGLNLSPIFNTESRAQESSIESTSTDSEILFARRVEPLLREKCLGCHGSDPDALEGSLDVRSLAKLLGGGESGEPSIVAGKPDLSPLYLAATRQSDDWSEMPPKEAEQLSAEQLSWLRDWIASGAAWPSAERINEIETEYHGMWSAEDGNSVKTSGGLDEKWTNRRYDTAGLWAYQPVSKDFTLPRVEATSQSTAEASPTAPAPLASRAGDAGNAKDFNPIDWLIEQSLPDGLAVAPRADRRTLIRLGCLQRLKRSKRFWQIRKRSALRLLVSSIDCWIHHTMVNAWRSTGWTSFATPIHLVLPMTSSEAMHGGIATTWFDHSMTTSPTINLYANRLPAMKSILATRKRSLPRASCEWGRGN